MRDPSQRERGIPGVCNTSRKPIDNDGKEGDQQNDEENESKFNNSWHSASQALSMQTNKHVSEGNEETEILKTSNNDRCQRH